MSKKLALVSALLLVSAAAMLRGLKSADRVILAGSFHNVAHKGHGRAEVVEQKDGERYLRLVGFQTYPADSLKVCMAPLPDAETTESVRDAGLHCVGVLEQGRVKFFLSRELDLNLFRAVVIWNPRAAVNFTTAPLGRID